MKIFVTGAAGFIGFHVTQKLLASGHSVVGYDGMTPYYDVNLKRGRLEHLRRNPQFVMHTALLEDKDSLDTAIGDFEPDVIIHLAAQAGVRYSLEHPQVYVDSNLVGTYNILEAARAFHPHHLLFASTSSVYGGNQTFPFSEVDRADFPVSLYAATKKAGEALSHSYSHLFKIPTTCFRFFTVYGPWGRPDMALFKFVERIENKQPIEVYGEGKMRRDFTYIDDLVACIELLIEHAPVEGEPVGGDQAIDSLSPVAPWRAVNIAGGQPVGLLDFIETIEDELGLVADKQLLPMQKGDVEATFADSRLLRELIGYEPSTPVSVGVREFVKWYREYQGE